MKSLKTQVLFFVGIFILVGWGIVAKTFSTIAGQEDDGIVLNLASKQRMLILEMMKEFNMLMNDIGEDEAVFEEKRSNLERTVKLFGENLNVLINGSRELNIPPAVLKDFKEQLLKANDTWSRFTEVFEKGFENGFFDEEADFFNKNEALLIGEINNAANIFAKSSKEKVISLKNLQIFYLIFILISLGVLILWLRKYILTPLKNVEDMIQELGKGNLDRRLKMSKMDEIGKMSRVIDEFADNLKYEVLAAFQKLSDGDFTFKAKGVIKEPLEKANENLNRLIIEISKAGEQVASVAGQIAVSGQSLSQGAAEQASSLEEITGSVEGMEGQTKQNAENATHANQIVLQTSDLAKKGNEQMQGMVKAMSEINESSKNISRIIKVIDEIAFQTNLLALNAAVEAARAGKHGKGFAVVADEVRNLAARSAKAAKKTEELIEGSIKRVEKGSQIANKTAEGLNEIMTSVAKVANLVGEIATASNEQAHGILEVNQSLAQIDKVTQQNAANAEESAAASEELAAQAKLLGVMLEAFKLNVKEKRPGTEEETALLKQQNIAGVSKITPNDGKGEVQRNEVKEVKPYDVIVLDREEFGKY